MQRLFRLSFWAALICVLAGSVGYAQLPQIYVSGRIAPGEVRIFQKDYAYIIDRDYVIGGTLIIEPGTKVYFYNNGRIIDSTGGRIIADGFARADYDQTLIPDPVKAYPAETNGGLGYADMKYFTYTTGAKNVVQPVRTLERTINKAKENFVFNVLLDTATRKIVDLQNPYDPTWPKNYFLANPSKTDKQVLVSFEQAVMFNAARLNDNPNNDPNMKITPWVRFNGKSVRVEPGTIQFIGQPENNFSREWGHIVILPGARAAFFRGCSFENFKKDTTVDRFDLYTQASIPGISLTDLKNLNKRFNNMTNGAGGVISSFSSRTWLLNCTFSNNFARNRGGALNLLQTPTEFPKNASDLVGVPFYNAVKNPNITNRFGDISEINTAMKIPAIDQLDEAADEAVKSDLQRQAFDDARISMFLGRMRNLKFINNKVQIANVGAVASKSNPSIIIVKDIEDAVANYPQVYGNKAFGGAIYINAENDPNQHMELGLGLNNKINVWNASTSKYDEVYLYDDTKMFDSFEATMNTVNNLQTNVGSEGSKGGALYVGNNTSLIVSGNFATNKAQAKFMITDSTKANNGFYAQGGAIYLANSWGRLTVRGGQERDTVKYWFINETTKKVELGSMSNRTSFLSNEAGTGGAIFVDGGLYTTATQMSPIIGGTDVRIPVRNYGQLVKFESNKATSFGGAVYSRRNMYINGAGGVEKDLLMGYSDNQLIMFKNNAAGFAGGAIDVSLVAHPTTLPSVLKTVQIVRAKFEGNVVGENIIEALRPEIRGGGAFYNMNGDLNLIKGVCFEKNRVFNGNGGALALVQPHMTSRRFIVSDLDVVDFDYNTGIAQQYTSTNDPFTFSNAPIPPDVRMLTRFIDNEIVLTDDVLASQLGSGTTQIGKGTPYPSENMMSAYWFDKNNGIVVGENGKIIRLSNAGTKWDYIGSNTTAKLNKITFISPSTGFIAAADGTILKTVNAGSTWTTTSTMYPGVSINDVKFTNSTNTGYAVLDNGNVLTSTDAGATWSGKNVATRNIKSISWVSSLKGFVVGDRGLLLKTTDGGDTWEAQIIPGLNSDLKDIIFKSALVGYAVGNGGTVVRTLDGGYSWDYVNAYTANDLKSVFFYGQTNGFIVGAKGTIVATTDGGTTWASSNVGVTNDLTNVYFTSFTDGFLTGTKGAVLSTIDGGAKWNLLKPADERTVDVKRYHQETSLVENGVGLGGAIYILDEINNNRNGRVDTLNFNRVRIQNNVAFTGSAIYSDNYDLKLIVNRSLINGNKVDARNNIGLEQNVITGPYVKADKFNEASSDLAGATIYGEIQGPIPSGIFSEAANSIYENNARFLIRLPDGPNTKGVLAGTTALGSGGTDTLRGNYWGKTEANVTMEIANEHIANQNAKFETFFVDYGDINYLPKVYKMSGTDLREQGPFEYNRNDYTYSPILLTNDATSDKLPGAKSIAEKVLFSGRIYDIYDKGTDIKTADYSKRRMSPIEDFAVGIAPEVKRFEDKTQPSYNKYVKRWLRNPFDVEKTDDKGNAKFGYLKSLQGEWQADKKGKFYHPIGYPLFLETAVNYDGDVYKNNYDARMLNESVFFVINETTGDFIRVGMKQVGEDAPFRETFRTRVELVPDSSNRTANTTLRRTYEGLMNLGSNGLYPFADYSNPILLEKLRKDASKEDASTLQGRKYTAPYNKLGSVENLLMDRPTPKDNLIGSGPAWNATYYAGERYTALPVDTGDVVRVISRTVLWREGVLAAYNGGMVFKVSASTFPPEFTGDVARMKVDTLVKIVASKVPGKAYDTIRYTEYVNRIFVSEDNVYPAVNGTYSSKTGDNVPALRDSIISVTAKDIYGWYNPLSVLDPTKYAKLDYSYFVSPNSALNCWLIGERKYNKTFNDANGYIQFNGTPLNPFVVPGGEDVVVSASNFPPNYKVIDLMKSTLQRDANGNITAAGQDTLNSLIYIYPKYMNAPVYMNTDYARFLQQDTIDYGSQATNSYQFRLNVIDKVPSFFEYDGLAKSTTMKKAIGNDTLVVKNYANTYFRAGVTETKKLRANLTDALRFQVDINTDDEQEDKWAKDMYNWVSVYGTTNYGFKNVTNSVDMDNQPVNSLVRQIKPVWMDAKNYVTYADYKTKDVNAIDFTSAGQLSVRIDAATATQMLTNGNKGGGLNLDTIMNVVVNDGHGGVAEKSYKLYVNVAPRIDIAQLTREAQEDREYNRTLLDPKGRVNVIDPNTDQKHKFELIYANDPRTEIYRDSSFKDETTSWNLANLKTTPSWLKINADNGALYGKPGMDDVTTSAKVTVVVWDEDGLPALETFTMVVKPTNHVPSGSGCSDLNCVLADSALKAKITVRDLDLLRKDPNAEELNIVVLSPDPSVVKVRPSTISGPATSADTTIEVYADNLKGITPDADGRVNIQLLITDKAGAVDTVTCKVKVSESVDFLVPVLVQNNVGASQELYFGTAANASTGDGKDGLAEGKLDGQYCETEIPPVPPTDVFDARWEIPAANGMYVNVFPRAKTGKATEMIYKAKFQAGGEDQGSTSINYPVTISWELGLVPKKTDAKRNPAGSTWYIRDAYSNGNIFSFNMADPIKDYRVSASIGSGLDPLNSNRFQIKVIYDRYNGFFIVHDWTSDVNGNEVVANTGIVNVAPNPVTNSSQITLNIAEAGKVLLNVYDKLGNNVATIINADYSAGSYNFQWNLSDVNGTELPSGTYTLQMISGSTVSNFPVVIVK